MSISVRVAAPSYLGPLTRVDDLPGRRTLRSTNANRLVVAYYQSNCRQPSLSGCGSTHLEYTATFRRLLKRFLFKQSYPGIIC